MLETDVDLRRRSRNRAVWGTALAVFFGVLITGWGIFQFNGAVIDTVAILSLVHAAMGLGFFAGFVILLVSRRWV